MINKLLLKPLILLLHLQPNQQLILFSKRRNYFKTNFIYCNWITSSTPAVLAQHSNLSYSTLFDLSGYDTNTAMAVPVDEAQNTPHIQFTNLMSLDENAQLVLLNPAPTHNPNWACYYPGSTFYIREVFEMFRYGNVVGADTRNLLLMYGDSSSPLAKGNNVWGGVEAQYISTKDSVILSPTTLFTI